MALHGFIMTGKLAGRHVQWALQSGVNVTQGNYCVPQEVDSWRTHLILYLKGHHQAKGLSPVTPARPRQPPLQQRSGGSSARKQGGICRLFNRAPAGCSYSDRCIFVHQCTVRRRTDHGRRNCPEEARGSGP